jgi:hypothetical protein
MSIKLEGYKMNITITLEQYNKIRRLSDFADFWADDSKPDSDFYLDQWESDKEEILQAQEVIQNIDANISLTTPKFEPAQEEE